MKKRTFRCGICLFVLISAVLSGCGKNDADGVNKSSDYMNNGKNGHVYMAETEDGIYYVVNNILYFYDTDSSLNTPVCSRMECEHKDSACDAYANNVSPFTNEVSNCLYGRIICAGDYLYMIEKTLNNDYILYQYDSGYGARKKMITLASLEDEHTILIDAGMAILIDDYLYYYVGIYDENIAQNGNVMTFECRRVSLKHGAKPETLGQFSYPYDYEMVLGDYNGMGIFYSDGSIYYIAAGMVRFYTKENQVQIHISRYNPESGLYEEVYSYVGNDVQAMFGTDLGYMSALANGDSMCMDNYGNLYIMMSSTQGSNIATSIVRYNPISKLGTIIYSAQREMIITLNSDGDYLYFWDVEPGEEQVFTVIDRDGNIKGEMELQYTDKMLENYAAYKQKFPEGEAVKPFVDISNMKVYGIGEDYILVGMECASCVFKELAVSDSALENTQSGSIGAVAILDKDSLFNGEDECIKQIYTYEP